MAALEFAFDTVKTGGHFLCKFYQGSEEKALETKLKRLFATSKELRDGILAPKAVKSCVCIPHNAWKLYEKCLLLWYLLGTVNHGCNAYVARFTFKLLSQ